MPDRICLDVEILCLITSPGHNLWFRSHDTGAGPGDHPAAYPDAVDVVAGKGVPGDRFYGKASRAASTMTFLPVEAVDAVGAALGRPAWPADGSLDPRLARRTVVVRGLDANALRRTEFTLDSGDGPVSFLGGGEASPCAWMDVVLAPGARDLLRGRGGLRANPTTDGRLRVGPAVLTTTADVDPARAGESVRRRGRLP